MTDERVSTRWAKTEADRDGWIPRPGDIIAGRYEVERNIGGGGMGSVVAARHRQLDERVAVKFLHPRLADDVANVERFVREAKAASRIKTEHVIRVHDIGTTEDGLPFIVMELLEGIDLAHLAARGPVPIALAVDCTLQAAEALAEAHAVGIIHRDIKPSNLWLSQRKDGTPLVKVLDFGISKLATTEGDAKLTETQAVFGSPSYMSPEQIRSAKRVDHRTDIWALGVVLYELLTTQLPFDADNVPGVLAAVTADDPRPLRSLRADVPATLEAVIFACLVKDPARRATLAELTAGLRPFASPAGVISADRVNRIEKPTMNLVPPPAGSSSVPSFAVTETVPDAVTQKPRSVSAPMARVALGMG
ncbi:MAG: serine/threonine protein kinase, partial [Labilithrix sp.]|nr:serine/threonine protein kinase [Labilithrix sp.]